MTFETRISVSIANGRRRLLAGFPHEFRVESSPGCGYEETRGGVTLFLFLLQFLHIFWYNFSTPVRVNIFCIYGCMHVIPLSRSSRIDVLLDWGSHSVSKKRAQDESSNSNSKLPHTSPTKGANRQTVTPGEPKKISTLPVGRTTGSEVSHDSNPDADQPGPNIQQTKKY